MLSVAVIDDHRALSEGLSVLLERRGFEVVGCAGTARAGEDLIAERVPDVAVVDLGLPDEAGADLILRLRQRHPRLKFVVYTGLSDPTTLADALHCGAQGFVAKPGSLDPLVDALRTVGRGDRYLDPALTELIDAGPEATGALLSDRESQVLGFLSDGLTGEEIASRLFLSPETIRTHVRNAMAKLQARTRTEAVVKALRSDQIR